MLKNLTIAGQIASSIKIRNGKNSKTHLSLLALASVLANGISLPSQASSSISLTPADDIQAIIKASPEGTSFLLQPGMYRQSLVPKNGNTFTGVSEESVKFAGSVALKFSADPTKKGLWVSNAAPDNSRYGKCQTAYPLCNYPQDLYINNIVQTPVSTLTGLKRGTWYFDRTTGELYLPFNPTGDEVEIGVLPFAFSSSATNVTISNLTVERYANAAQFGAIGAQLTGANWVVKNVEVRFNHGVGVKLGTNSQLLNSFIHGNGELGISLGGTDSQAIGNEISYNNYANYALGWESGGSKFSNTKNLLIKSNFVHNNNGPGLWSDTDNVDTTYENNTVTDNFSTGIQDELNFAMTIKDNIVSGNGAAATPAAWLWNAQISIQNSADAVVTGNTIEVPADGANAIAIIDQNRGSGPMGEWIAANNTISNNTITFDSTVGKVGMVNDTGSHPVLGNSFTDNTYILKADGDKAEHWQWFGEGSFKEWQAEGQDVKGSVKEK